MLRPPLKLNIMYFRVSDEDKAAILRAALIMKEVSVSEFIRDVAVEHALAVLRGEK